MTTWFKVPGYTGWFVLSRTQVFRVYPGGDAHMTAIKRDGLKAMGASEVPKPDDVTVAILCLKNGVPK